MAAGAKRFPRRRLALILILLVDVGYIAWGAMAAASPGHEASRD